MEKISYSLIDLVARDIVINVLKNLSSHKGFEVIEEIDPNIFQEMVRDLATNIIVPRLMRFR